MLAFTSGFLVSLGLIVAIGAQNAFVLRQGLKGEHVWPVTLTCALSDAILIAAGVAGFGLMVAAAPWLAPALTYAGAAFLVWYGLSSLRAAATGTGALDPARAEPSASGLPRVMGLTLAFTWLNPHVYLDSVVFIGSVSTQFDEPATFGAGAATASALFFLALGHGARFLRPVFAKPEAWRVLEGVIGVTMLALAGKLMVGIS
ncbi:LysE/ArgO family amino acid transporter [Salinarimonas sp.]|uniref:LysE/ArgO family amino acid transporter n=1 Tax=Salinarimonas sp. TaxID=2766526 RepID=UPI00391C3C53